MKLNKIVKQRIKWSLIFSPLILLSIALILYSAYGSMLDNVHHLSTLRKYTGIVGLIIFGGSIGLYILRLLLKNINPKNINKLDEIFKNKSSNLSKHLNNDNITVIKKFLSFWAKIFQSLHIPLSIIGLSIIGYHVYLAFHMGWKWTIGYILGLLAAICLLILVILGIARIFNKSIKGHKYVGIAFIILAILHLITI